MLSFIILIIIINVIYNNNQICLSCTKNKKINVYFIGINNYKNKSMLVFFLNKVKLY